jgi:hypothetical protein
MQDKTFFVVARAEGENPFYGHHFGTYSGSAWSWTADLWNDGGERWATSWSNVKNFYLSGPGAAFGNQFWSIPGKTMYTVSASYYTNSSAGIHSFSSSSAVALCRLAASPNTVYMCLPYSGTIVTELPNFTLTSGAINGAVMGSIQGDKVFLINTGGVGEYLGQIYIGDTSGVTLKTTWTYARYIRDAVRLGGGALVMSVSSCGGNEEFIRINRDGSGDADQWESMTGNFWNLTSGAQTFVGMGLVYL